MHTANGAGTVQTKSLQGQQFENQVKQARVPVPSPRGWVVDGVEGQLGGAQKMINGDVQEEKGKGG